MSFKGIHWRRLGARRTLGPEPEIGSPVRGWRTGERNVFRPDAVLRTGPVERVDPSPMRGNPLG